MTQSSLSILLVEDDHAVANILATILRNRSHTVTLASSGEEALRCLPHDVVITDVGLGGMSGLDVLEELLMRGEAPRAVVLSGDQTLEHCRRAMKLGAVDYLAKPVNIDLLLQLVEEETGIELHDSSTYARTYLATRETCERAARDLAAFAMRSGIGPSARGRMATATSEAMENVWRHAYPSGTGTVWIEAFFTDSSATVCVRDEGCGMDTERVQHLPVNNEGLTGLARMAALSEDLSIQSSPKCGTRIEMGFTTFTARFDQGLETDLSELDWLSPQLARTVAHSLADPKHGRSFQLSPAIAVSVGRLLSGPKSTPQD